MYTLVVVDMQAKFPRSLEGDTLLHCKRAVRKAIKNRAAIVFLEFSNYGPTLPALTKLTENYDRVYHATKGEWDGSMQTLHLAQVHRLNTSKFRICGVYTECCVDATIQGLRSKKPNAKMEMIHKACGASHDSDQKRIVEQNRKLKNVRIVDR